MRLKTFKKSATKQRTINRDDREPFFCLLPRGHDRDHSRCRSCVRFGAYWAVAYADTARFWPIAWLLIRLAWWLIVVHLLEIAVWGLFFWWQRCLPDAESSFYFSGVTYATIGYGDLVLPNEWRLFGPVEGLTGILMCGLSTAFFFAVVSRRILPYTDGKERV